MVLECHPILTHNSNAESQPVSSPDKDHVFLAPDKDHTFLAPAKAKSFLRVRRSFGLFVGLGLLVSHAARKFGERHEEKKETSREQEQQAYLSR